MNTGTSGEFGFSGIMQGAAIIFFAYIGFDQAATTAQEARNPQRDVPWSIIAALIISTTLYVVMSAVMTGMVSYTELNVAAPVAVALDAHPELKWLGLPVKIGAIMGLTSVILMSLLGQPRIFMAMSRDGLLPPSMQKVHPKYRTPHIATIVTGVVAAFFAGVFPLDVLGELISIGILLAFTAVCAGVVVLRRTQPDMARPFRVPFATFTGVAGVAICLAMTALPAARHVDPAGGVDVHRFPRLLPVRLQALADPAAGLTCAPAASSGGCSSLLGALLFADVREVCVRSGSGRSVRRLSQSLERQTRALGKAPDRPLAIQRLSNFPARRKIARRK